MQAVATADMLETTHELITVINARRCMELFLERHNPGNGARTPSVKPVDPAKATELMRRISAGDAAALDELVACYWSRLVQYITQFLPDLDAAEDIAQSTFVRLWEKRASWRPTGQVSGYIYHIARNLALNERRRYGTRRKLTEAVRLHETGRRNPTPLDEMEVGELRAAVTRAIDALPERRREIFRLSRFDGLTYAEIARVMEISPQTVANQMSAALDTLRIALAVVIE